MSLTAVDCVSKRKATNARPPRETSELPRPIWLAAILLLLLAYAGAGWLILHPSVSETYRQTYVEPLFSVYPDAPRFGPEGGLAYEPGTTIGLGRDRRHLARLDWSAFGTDPPILNGARGRLVLRLPEAARSGGDHELTLSLDCGADGPKPLLVSVGEVALGTVLCGTDGPATSILPIPRHLVEAPGLLTITIHVPPALDDLGWRWRRRLRLSLLRLHSFRLAPAG